MQSIIGLAQKPQPICDAYIEDGILTAALEVPSTLQPFIVLSVRWRLPLYFPQFLGSSRLYVNDRWTVSKHWNSIVFKLDLNAPVETVVEQATASFFFKGIYQALLPSDAESARALATELANKLDIHVGQF